MPGRASNMDAPRAAFGAGLAGPLLLDTYKQFAQTMKTPISDPHPLHQFKQQQRFVNTPLGAFRHWLEEQLREASAFYAAESLAMKTASQAGAPDWDKAAERAELAAQVIRDIERSIQHIEAFKGVMLHEQFNPRS